MVLHKCNICKKSLSSNQYLKVHTKTVHEGQKNHQCVKINSIQISKKVNKICAYKISLLNIPCILIQIALLHIQKLTFSASHI